MNPWTDKTGRVTLHCGDCREILPTLAAGSVDAVVTDPPYGIGYHFCGGGPNGPWPGANMRPILGDDTPFDPACFLTFRTICCWGADHYRARLPEGGTILAWDKHVGVGPDNNFVDCEFAWTNQKVKRNIYRRLWKGAIMERRNDPTRCHPSQKPIGLMVWCMEVCAVPDAALVCDPFAGSGTTGIACIRTGRRFVGIELDQHYYEIARDRLERELAQRRMW